MPSDDELDKLCPAGNKFALTFVVFFSFVYFVIIDPHFARDMEPERHIDRTLVEIRRAETLLHERQMELYARRDQELKKLEKTRADHKAWELAEAKAQEAQFPISEKIIQLGVAHQVLSKAKLEKKEYSIPLVSVSLDEDTLLKFFPVAIVLCFIRLFTYRLSLLRGVPQGNNRALPLWAAPIPFDRTGFWKWVGVNLTGFVFLGSIVFLTLRFLLLYARENPTALLLAAGDAVLVALWVLFYAATVFFAILGFPRTNVPPKDIVFE